MNIIQFVTNADRAGAPNHLLILASFLSRQGHSVTCVFGNEGPICTDLFNKGISTYCLRSLKSNFNIFSSLLSIYRFWKIVYSLSPDLIHVHSSSAAFVARIVGFICNVKVIYTVHGFGFGRGKPIFQSLVSYLIELFLSRIPKAYIFVSSNDLTIGSNRLFLSANKIFLVPNGIPDLQSHLFNKIVPSVDCLMLARVHPQKDYLTLFRALHESPFTLSVAGSGTDSPQFISFASKLLGPLISNVRFLGDVVDVSSLISTHKVIVLSSVYESLPISLIEGLRASKPLIATRVGDNDKLVLPGENGFLFEYGDYKSLATFVSRIIQNSIVQSDMGKQSRFLFENLYTSDIMCDRIVKIYDSCFASV